MEIYTFDIYDGAEFVERLNVPSNDAAAALISANEEAHAMCYQPQVVPVCEALAA